MHGRDGGFVVFLGSAREKVGYTVVHFLIPILGC
jgi:hypothetical protein